MARHLGKKKPSEEGEKPKKQSKFRMEWAQQTQALRLQRQQAASSHAGQTEARA